MPQPVAIRLASQQQHRLLASGIAGRPSDTFKPTPQTYIKTGVFIPAEIGYASTRADKPFPNGVDVGGYLDTTGVNDTLYNRSGLPYPLYHGAYRINHDHVSIYAQAQQTIWRPDRFSARGLTVSGGALFGLSGPPQTNRYFYSRNGRARDRGGAAK